MLVVTSQRIQTCGACPVVFGLRSFTPLLCMYLGVVAVFEHFTPLIPDLFLLLLALSQASYALLLLLLKQFLVILGHLFDHVLVLSGLVLNLLIIIALLFNLFKSLHLSLFLKRLYFAIFNLLLLKEYLLSLLLGLVFPFLLGNILVFTVFMLHEGPLLSLSLSLDLLSCLVLVVDDGGPLVVIPSSVLRIVPLRRSRALVFILRPSQSLNSILLGVRRVLDAVRADFKRVQLSNQCFSKMHPKSKSTYGRL